MKKSEVVTNLLVFAVVGLGVVLLLQYYSYKDAMAESLIPEQKGQKTEVVPFDPNGEAYCTQNYCSRKSS